MSDLKKGEEVSWNWGGGQPSGKVAEVVEEGKAEVESKKGNTISKNASEDDPAVVIERSGNNVVKRAHELNETEE
ncbi:uncharacterized protein I303_105781 [Kwoniella dejecticola CBS 10117]|uniref:Hypervirulence associated protein TUDOR domain-containing protein n=1 Tax=Kwoniella dejecticola CBS 10117 TaxID=1296121 RepID=A0A1A6A0F6_9TREE|nr:uncharacterized protein I303_05803 [Kwoniella dejecticola CBS 10117]OBR83523.1 hypothetical protein I303_05803 [Kwoniella dejecticola CBS 10117]